MTTNGLLLTQQLPALVTAGLTSVNVSLDSLEEKKFAKLTRRSGKSLPRVLSSVYAGESIVCYGVVLVNLSMYIKSSQQGREE